MASSFVWTLPGSWPSPAVAPGRREPAGLPMMASIDSSLPELDERALVDACLAGQPGAFELIVDRHRRSVYQLCYRFVSNHEDASDLSQDVFLRAYRGLRGFRGGSSLATWLYRIGVNVCLNRVSVKTPQTESLDERQHVDRRAESAVEQLVTGERAARLRAAIAQLPRKQRAT